MTQERQLPQLIEVAEDNPWIFLLLGGNGNLKDSAAEAAQRNPNISYLGFVNPAKIPFYTAVSDVIFYGFDPDVPNAKFSAPNKLFEALAAGKPILTGNFGEIGKIVGKLDCGIVIEKYSKENILSGLNYLKSIVDSSEYKTNALNAAREKYHWKNAENVLLDQYARIM